jgi:hypothetical protein
MFSEALLARGSSEFVEPESPVCGLILYEQLFYEIKTAQIKPLFESDQQFGCYKIHVMYFVPINVA